MLMKCMFAAVFGQMVVGRLVVSLCVIAHDIEKLYCWLLALTF